MRHPNVKIPPCAKWNAWTGPEVEGTTDIGEKTLFVRFAELSKLNEHMAQNHYKRIWLCWDFILAYRYGANFQCLLFFIQLMKKQDITVAVEIVYSVHTMSCDPASLARLLKAEGVDLYIKLHDLDFLNSADHLCVGLPYTDTILPFRGGNTMSPAFYMDDKEVQI